VLPAEDSQSGTGPHIELTSPDEMSQQQVLHFAVKSISPQKFSPTEKIQVATDDELFHTELTTAAGNLTLQDPQTVLAVLDPATDLGASAFGPLKFRAVDAAGAAGDWQPLQTLVRLPLLSQIQCANTPEKQCKLQGQRLFLLAAVSSDPQFANAVQVPEGFFQTSLDIPAASGKALYVKLRDDPSVVNTATVPLVMGQKAIIGQK